MDEHFGNPAMNGKWQTKLKCHVGFDLPRPCRHVFYRKNESIFSPLLFLATVKQQRALSRGSEVPQLHTGRRAHVGEILIGAKLEDFHCCEERQIASV